MRKLPKPAKLPTAARRKAPAGVKTTARQGSTVETHEYSPETGHLTVTFRGGRQYRYSGIDKEMAQKFADAGSKGSFLHSSIIGKFDGTKI